MMEWAVALTIGVVAVVIVTFIFMVRHCRRHEEPNLQNMDEWPAHKLPADRNAWNREGRDDD